MKVWMGYVGDEFMFWPGVCRRGERPGGYFVVEEVRSHLPHLDALGEAGSGALCFPHCREWWFDGSSTCCRRRWFGRPSRSCDKDGRDVGWSRRSDGDHGADDEQQKSITKAQGEDQSEAGYGGRRWLGLSLSRVGSFSGGCCNQCRCRRRLIAGDAEDGRHAKAVGEEDAGACHSLCFCKAGSEEACCSGSCKCVIRVGRRRSRRRSGNGKRFWICRGRGSFYAGLSWEADSNPRGADGGEDEGRQEVEDRHSSGLRSAGHRIAKLAWQLFDATLQQGRPSNASHPPQRHRCTPPSIPTMSYACMLGSRILGPLHHQPK